ncbi:MAG: hypothetical protein ACI93T_000242, partial [Porticoccaceae bacterium]
NCSQPRYMSVADIRCVAGVFILRLIERSLSGGAASPAVVQLKSLAGAFDNSFVNQLTPPWERTGHDKFIENSQSTRDVLTGLCVDDLCRLEVVKKNGLGVRMVDSISVRCRQEIGIDPPEPPPERLPAHQSIGRPITRGLDIFDAA